MFEGKLVRLRAYEQDDLAHARNFLNHPDVAQMMNPHILFPLRQEDEQKWYESLSSTSEKEYAFAIERKGSPAYLGGCGVHNIDGKNHHAIIGLFVGAEHRGQGYGSDALRILVRFCFNELNLNKVSLKVFSFNQRAIECYRKFGFVLEGTLRQQIFRNGGYHDELIMSILRSEWEKISQH